MISKTKVKENSWLLTTKYSTNHANLFEIVASHFDPWPSQSLSSRSNTKHGSWMVYNNHNIATRTSYYKHHSLHY